MAVSSTLFITKAPFLSPHHHGYRLSSPYFLSLRLKIVPLQPKPPPSSLKLFCCSHKQHSYVGTSPNPLPSDSLREECGIVGIHGDPDAASLCYVALHALQHRGQEGAGIVTSHANELHHITGLGLVSDVIDQNKLDNHLPGSAGIGHVRYSTAGASTLKNVQPFVAGSRFGSVSVAHNGNFVNYLSLRHKLEDSGSIFNTTSDTEVILHLIAQSNSPGTTPFYVRIIKACEQLQGAYSLVFITDKEELIAVRGPYGIRPLVMGERNNGAVVFASETCALDSVDAKIKRVVEPGEVIVVAKDGEVRSFCLMEGRPSDNRPKQCVFELIYFSMPQSVTFGYSVYDFRLKLGARLAKDDSHCGQFVNDDEVVVIAVPDSGIPSSTGYAAEIGVPYSPQGLIRSHYVGRTFIQPSQKIRTMGVKLKLAPVRSVVEGKKVVVVDDSIVRGTTSSKIVKLIRDAGAKEVHVRIASPPIIGCCYYGVDTPNSEELISHRLNLEQTREFIGADSLAFLSLDSLKGLLGVEADHFCYACFSGNYPIKPPS